MRLFLLLPTGGAHVECEVSPDPRLAGGLCLRESEGHQTTARGLTAKPCPWHRAGPPPPPTPFPSAFHFTRPVPTEGSS